MLFLDLGEAIRRAESRASRAAGRMLHSTPQVLRGLARENGRRHWIKLYTEILSDPKIGRLTDRQYQFCINTFLLAGLVDDGGQVGSTDDIAWQLRMSADDLTADLEVLAGMRIVRCDPDGWCVTHWGNRQTKPPSAQPERVLERVARHRENERNEDASASPQEVPASQPKCNGPVTTPEKNREEKNREWRRPALTRPQSDTGASAGGSRHCDHGAAGGPTGRVWVGHRGDRRRWPDLPPARGRMGGTGPIGSSAA